MTFDEFELWWKYVEADSLVKDMNKDDVTEALEEIGIESDGASIERCSLRTSSVAPARSPRIPTRHLLCTVVPLSLTRNEWVSQHAGSAEDALGRQRHAATRGLRSAGC